MTREMVLDVGYEGGGFELFADLEDGAATRFYYFTGGRSMFGDDDAPRVEHGPITWELALETQLERNRWLILYPCFVHPALFARVRAAIERQPERVGGEWRDAVGMRPEDGGTYVLLGADGRRYRSATKGTLGGNSKLKVYGTLACGSARSAIERWGTAYTSHRVFFADEATAIAAGYRPCGNCLRKKYAAWKAARAATEK